jgi:hypothetical protein
MVVITILDERNELVGIYPDMRRERQGVSKEDFRGLVDVGLKFFGPLFPKSKLKAEIAVQTSELPKGR